MDDIKQKYKAQVTIYHGKKIHLFHHDNYSIRFNLKDGWYAELDCGFTKDTQKTLSSTKPSFVTVTSSLTNEDINHIININDKFTIIDHGIPAKIGRGHIIEVVKQE